MELYKKDDLEAFINECLHIRVLLLSLEKTLTRILEMSDMIQVKRLKAV
jgi:hypothetical protein